MMKNVIRPLARITQEVKLGDKALQKMASCPVPVKPVTKIVS